MDLVISPCCQHWQSLVPADRVGDGLGYRDRCLQYNNPCLHFNIHRFNLTYLRTILKQVPYLYKSIMLIPDGIHLIFERGLRGEARPILICWALSKEAYFYKGFGMQGSGLSLGLLTQRGSALPLSHNWAIVLVWLIKKCKLISNRTVKHLLQVTKAATPFLAKESAILFTCQLYYHISYEISSSVLLPAVF